MQTKLLAFALISFLLRVPAPCCSTLYLNSVETQAFAIKSPSTAVMVIIGACQSSGSFLGAGFIA